MSWAPFQARSCGKWVLTGEHSVLRGGTAIALPHPEFRLELRFMPGSAGLEVSPPSARPVIEDILVAVQDDQQEQGKTFSLPTGRLEIESSIPIGAGLGSSAALCVAIGRWLSERLGLSGAAALQDFATGLEHRFHGRSSGMDVAAIVAAEPISFAMPGSGGGRSGATPLGIRSLPKFAFHDTGLRARTSDCVMSVEKIREKEPRYALEIDERMGEASRLALEGLVRYDSSKSAQALDLVARAMRQAHECFEAWRLVPADAQKLLQDLLARGALAAKITGAGGGGMIVSLWD